MGRKLEHSLSWILLELHVIREAKKYGARGVGIEIDPDLVRRSQDKARDEGIEHLVEFREQDALKVDVSPATVVTLYMLLEYQKAAADPLAAVKARLTGGLHDFPIECWPPLRVEKVKGHLFHDHTIYLWKTEGETKSKIRLLSPLACLCPRPRLDGHNHQTYDHIYLDTLSKAA